jgi:hypothetical protein
MDISWVTAGGWLLSTQLDSFTTTTPTTTPTSTRRSSTDTVLYAPPLVELRSSDGSLLTLPNDISTNNNTHPKKKKVYSVPTNPVLVNHHHCASSSFGTSRWYFSEVPKVTQILPHHDKYVASAPPPRPVSSSESQKNNTLLFCQEDGTRTNVHRMKLKLPTAAAAAPSAMAVHPNGEWMVLGVDHRLVVMMLARR